MMKKSNIQKRMAAVLVFAFVFHVGCYAQVWNKTYDAGKPVLLFSSIIKHDSIFHVVGVNSSYDGFSYPRIFIGELNMNGDLLKYKCLYDSTNKTYGAFYNSLVKGFGEELVFAGQCGDSLSKLAIIRKNLQTDTIQLYEYSVPNSYAFYGYNALQCGNELFVCGVQTDITANSPNNVLLKIDLNNNLIWTKFFGLSAYTEYAKSLIKLKNGNLLIGSIRSVVTQNNEIPNTWLLEVDTAGNLVRNWIDNNDSSFAAESLHQTDDGGFIYATQSKEFQSANSTCVSGSIVKLDSSFNKQWTFTDGDKSIYTAINDIEILPDGCIVAAGNKPYYYTDSSILSGWILKLSPQGNLLWEHIYRGINQTRIFNFLSDIDVLDDGSLVAVGQCQSLDLQPPQVGWFLKLDSNGCEIENCMVGLPDNGQQPTDDGKMQVYPNPFTNNITIVITGEHATKATFSITNLMGQTVYQQTESNLATGYTKMLNLCYLPSGVYFVAVTTGDKTMVERVVKE